MPFDSPSLGMEHEVQVIGQVDTFISTLARGPQRVAISTQSPVAKPIACTRARRRVRMKPILLPQPRGLLVVMEIHHKMTMMMMRRRRAVPLTPKWERQRTTSLKTMIMRGQASSTNHRPLMARK